MASTKDSSKRSILHCSDIHVGRGFREEPAERFLALAHQLRPDAVVVSGDLTMRARRWQFLKARALLERFPQPLVVIPGNHDIPLYLLPMRLFAPFYNYRRFAADLNRAPLVLGNVCIYALNTINPFRHQQGILRPEALEEVRRWAKATPPDSWRVLVVHQHFANTPDNPRPGIYPHAQERLHEIAAAGVHLVLHGHVHQSSLRTAQEMFPGCADRVVVAAVGTLSCARTRGSERIYQFNHIEFDADALRLHIWNWNVTTRTFEPVEERVFARQWFEG
ncbi:MAG: metallophosphoesterase [Candidatus Sumerlaea chitinivorans]|jgi:3',5'-cyclic AMP phosphodiesterase CpdA|nr:metallophosphoesterase [Candidatus Sumerlaea chitinivorans]